VTELLGIDDPRRRLTALFDQVYKLAPWAIAETDLLAREGDHQVRGHLAGSTRRRIEFIGECLRQLGVDEEVSAQTAFEAYALWIGSLQLQRSVPEVGVAAAPEGSSLAALWRLLPGE
jgi:hypothetical protein